MNAKAFKRAAFWSPSERAINSSAASLNRGSTSVLTVWSCFMVSLEVALSTSCGWGIPIGVNLNPALFSIVYN